MSRPPNEARDAARISGAQTFSLGEPCICGDDLHYTTSGACVTCASARSRLRYSRNVELISRQAAARYQKRKQADDPATDT